MPKPMIAVCRNNHVYDAAVYKECPFCRKKGPPGGYPVPAAAVTPEKHWSDSDDDPEDRTVNLFESTVDSRRIHSSESGRRSRAHESTGTRSITGTSGWTNSSSSYGRTRQRHVAGWLVFLSGKDYGISLQIMEGQNFISLDEKGYARVTREPRKGLDCFASITVTSDNRFLTAPFRGAEIRINGKTVSSSQEMREHHILKYRDCEMMFIPFTGVHYKWR